MIDELSDAIIGSKDVGLWLPIYRKKCGNMVEKRKVIFET